MLLNSSDTPETTEVAVEQKSSIWRRAAMVVGLPLWVFLGFMLAQAIVLALVNVLNLMNVPFEMMSETVLNTVFTAVIYAISVLVVVGVPWFVNRRPTTLKDLGLHRLPSWLDMLWAPAGYVAYAIGSVLLMAAAVAFLPFFDVTEAQDVGFNNVIQGHEYILAFVSLVVVAPVAEEVLFRGYLLQKIRKRAPLWIAILITSLLFAVVHFAWNVGVDVFVLSIALCVLRVATGSLWAPILLHMIKNGIAFYFLFISPIIPGMM